MRLAVIVPRYAMTPEVAEVTEANLRRIKEVAQIPTTLVVIDNGSKIPLNPDLRKDRAVVGSKNVIVDVYVEWPENRGVAPAWNEGRWQSAGAWQKTKRPLPDVFAFVTSTTTVEPGWDTRLCQVAMSGRYIAMPFTNGEKPYNGLGITGWCWAISRELADEVGLFDETFVPVQYEDTDFFHRAIYDHGVELVNVAGANVRRTTGRQSVAGAPWGNRFNLIHMANRFRYAWKHNLDPNDTPPFWKSPLRTIEVRDADSAQ
jgi:hypothetical protein